MAKVCKHCFISGVVQGVFYRANTEERATKLGLTGWVRNVPDGRVEALICGDENKVNELIKWMEYGPPAAAVDKVEAQDVKFEKHDKFIVR